MRPLNPAELEQQAAELARTARLVAAELTRNADTYDRWAHDAEDDAAHLRSVRAHYAAGERSGTAHTFRRMAARARTGQV